MRRIVVRMSAVFAMVIFSFTLAGCPTQASYPSTITPIYAATNLGLEVYDGTSWKNYTTANGLASNNVTSVVVSGSGSGAVVFVGTAANGISYSTGSTWSTWTIANGLGSNVINNLFLTSNLYAATSSGLSIYNYDSSAPLWTTSILGASSINGVNQYGGYTYIAADKLYIYNGTEPRTSYAANLIVASSSIVTAVIVDSNMDIIAATDKGVAFLGYGASSFVTLSLPPSATQVNGMFLDNNGYLYAATATGLYNEGGSSALPILSGNVHCVYVDGAGTIYAGTDTGLKTSTNGGSTWSTSTWSAKVNAVVTTAPLYSF